MTEAGQIFAMLRSASAAELAKRFNNLDHGGAGGQQPVPSPQPGGDPSRSGPGPAGGFPQPGAASGAAGGAATGSGVALPGAGQVAATVAVAVVDTGLPAGSGTPLPGADGADVFAASRPTAMRAAVSLASLAPPRADLIRFLAEAGGSGLHRMSGSGSASGFGATGTTGPALGAETARSGPDAATRPGLAPAALEAMRPGQVASGPAVDSETTTQSFVTQPTVRAAAALATGLGALLFPSGSTSADGAGTVGVPGGDPAPARAGAAPLGGQAIGAAGVTAAVPGAVAGAAAGGVEGPTAAEAAPDAGPAGAATTAPGDAVRLAARSATVAQVAFAEAVVALIDAAGAGRSGSVASGVIFNAAMIPGWPFPSAFAKDGAEAINPKALLHRLAAAAEGMSPQEAAEYLARIGGGHLFLRNLRRILTQLDMLDKEDVKGLLFSFLETLSTIATGLEKAFKLMAEGAALQAAVAHGEVPEDNGRPGRRRLRL